MGSNNTVPRKRRVTWPAPLPDQTKITGSRLDVKLATLIRSELLEYLVCGIKDAEAIDAPVSVTRELRENHRQLAAMRVPASWWIENRNKLETYKQTKAFWHPWETGKTEVTH